MAGVNGEGNKAQNTKGAGNQDKTRYISRLPSDVIEINEDPKIKSQYTSKSSDKKLQNFIKKVNDDQIEFAKKTGELIQKLQIKSRQNDANLLINIEKLLLDVVKSSKVSDGIDTSKFKKNYLTTKITSINTLTDEQKQQITTKIEELFDGTGKDDIKKEFDKETDQIIDKIKNKQYIYTASKNETIALYRSILENEHFMNKITRHVSVFITNVALKHDKTKFQKLINEFKTDNKQIFEQSKISQANGIKFSKLIKDGGMASLFLFKYNRAVLRTFQTKLKNLKAKSMDEVRNNAMSELLGVKIQQAIAKWVKSKKRLMLLCNPKYLKKKLGKVLEKKLKSIKEFFKFGGVKSLIFGSLNMASSLIIGTGKFLFKTALLGGRMGLKLISGIYHIGTKIIGGTITILKNILGTTMKIAKSVVGGAYQILKHLKLFLLTPFGAYTVGFIIGFLKQKIKKWALESFEWLQKKWDKLKKWMKAKDARWSVLTETEEGEDEYGQKILIPKENLYGLLKKNIISIFDTLKKYINVFKDDDPNNWDQIKKLWDEPKKDKEGNKVGKTYSDRVIEFEQWFVNVYNWLDQNLIKGGIIQKIQKFYEDMTNSSFVVQFTNMIRLTGTGVPSAKIAAGITNTVSNAINAGAGVLASFFPMFGPIIGATAGVISGIASWGISNAFKIKSHKSKETIETANVIHSLNKKHSLGVLGIRRKSNEKRSKIEEEIQKLKKEIEQTSDTQKKQEKQKTLDDKEKQLRIMSLYDDDQLTLMQERISTQSDSTIVGNSIESLIDYQIGKIDYEAIKGKSIDLDKKRKEIKEKTDSETYQTYVNIQQAAIDTKKFLLKKYAMKYNNGAYGIKGTEEAIKKYKDEVNKEYHNQFLSKQIFQGINVEQFLNYNIEELNKFFNQQRSQYARRALNTNYRDFKISFAEHLGNPNQKLQNITQGIYGDITDIDKFTTNKVYDFKQSLSGEDRNIVSQYFDVFRQFAFEDDDKHTKFNEVLQSLKQMMGKDEKKSKESSEPKILSKYESKIGTMIRHINGFLLPSNVSQEKLESLYTNIEFDQVSENTKKRYEEAKSNFETKSKKSSDLKELYIDIKNEEELIINPQMIENQIPKEYSVSDTTTESDSK